MTDFTRRKLKSVDHLLSACFVTEFHHLQRSTSSPTSTSQTKIVTSLMLRGQSRQTRPEPCHSKWPLLWNWTYLGHCGLPGHPDCLPLHLNFTSTSPQLSESQYQTSLHQTSPHFTIIRKPFHYKSSSSIAPLLHHNLDTTTTTTWPTASKTK